MATSDEIIISMAKRCADKLVYTTKDNNRAFQLITFRAEDEIGMSIPGVTIEICLRTPQIVDDCKYTFTIFRLVKQRRRRIYQLEVVPRDKKSHNGPPRIYGPHVHQLDTVTAVNLDLCCKDYHDWLVWFCQQINLTLEREPPPPFGNDDGLQLADQESGV